MHLFEQPGAVNTAATLTLAHQRASQLGIDTIVVATTSGRTGLEALERCPVRRLVVVTHSTGFSEVGVQEADPRAIDMLRSRGVRVVTTTHVFGGAGRAVRRKFGTYQVDEVIAQTLRLFGQGAKVAIEVSLMAADAGLLPMDRDIIAIGGSESGADTALVLRPAHAQDLFDLRVREIVCKPY